MNPLHTFLYPCPVSFGQTDLTSCLPVNWGDGEGSEQETTIKGNPGLGKILYNSGFSCAFPADAYPFLRKLKIGVAQGISLILGKEVLRPAGNMGLYFLPLASRIFGYFFKFSEYFLSLAY